MREPGLSEPVSPYYCTTFRRPPVQPSNKSVATNRIPEDVVAGSRMEGNRDVE